MKNSDRYNVPTNEDYEPGSNNQVLKNYLGATSKESIENLEAEELERAEIELLKIFDDNYKFTAEDISNIHELWLGDIYPSAGKYRTVNMEKDGFLFARADFIPSLMTKFESEYLAKYTPCHYTDLDELALALGIIHVEFIVIHPFREGNGRTARLLADLMVMQAKRPPLDFSAIDQTTNLKGFEQYIAAIHAGFNGNYTAIQKIFKLLLK